MLLESRSKSPINETRTQQLHHFLQNFAVQEPRKFAEFTQIARGWHDQVKGLAVTKEAPFYLSGGALALTGLFGALEKLDPQKPFEFAFIFTLLMTLVHTLPTVLSSESEAQQAQVAYIKELENHALHILADSEGYTSSWPIKDILQLCVRSTSW